jgi:hypothetical protein
MESVREWLSDQFWSGKRWVVAEPGKPIARRPACYVDYWDAAEACRSVRDRRLRVRILASLLKAARPTEGMVPAPEERRKLKVVVGGYPLSLFFSPVDWMCELLEGNYYPMVWEKEVHPLLTVCKWLVCWRSGAVRVKCRELFAARDFSAAMQRFTEESRRLPAQEGELLLAGQFSDMPCSGQPREVGDGVSSLIFYRLAVKASVPAALEQVHDPVSPVWRYIPLFVRYNSQRTLLTFYNSSLQRIRPGDEPAGIDLRLFDFGPLPEHMKNGRL